MSLFKLVPTDDPRVCDHLGCTAYGLHDVLESGAELDVRLCCEHLHDLMYEVGKDEPDFEVGFSKFKMQHEMGCGYVRA